MAAPSSYTEAGLKTYMIAALSSVADDLGLTTASAAIGLAVTATERLLGVSDVATLTEMGKLEDIARWRAWLVALDTASSQIDLKAGSAQLWQSQMFAQIERQLARAELAAMQYSEVADALAGGSVAYVASVSTGGDPYAYQPIDEWR